MRRLYGRGYDKDGEVAATGTIHRGHDRLPLDHPFYARKPPRSAWRLDFGSAYADGMLETWKHLPPQDVIATLTRFTAISITKAITELIGDISRRGHAHLRAAAARATRCSWATSRTTSGARRPRHDLG